MSSYVNCSESKILFVIIPISLIRYGKLQFLKICHSIFTFVGSNYAWDINTDMVLLAVIDGIMRPDFWIKTLFVSITISLMRDGKPQLVTNKTVYITV